MLKLTLLGFQEIELGTRWLNLTPNTPVKIKNNYDELLPETFSLLMKQADKREKRKDPCKEIPI
jgi:hypothetical protein